MVNDGLFIKTCFVRRKAFGVLSLMKFIGFAITNYSLAICQSFLAIKLGSGGTRRQCDHGTFRLSPEFHFEADDDLDLHPGPKSLESVNSLSQFVWLVICFWSLKTFGAKGAQQQSKKQVQHLVKEKRRMLQSSRRPTVMRIGDAFWWHFKSRHFFCYKY